MQNSVFDVRGASAAPTASVPLTGDDEPVAPAASTASVPLTGAPPDPTITESQEHGDAKESVADQVVRTTLDKFDTFWWNPCQDQKTPGTLMQPNSKLLQSLRLSYSIAAWAQVHAQHNAAFMKKVEVSQATGMKNVLTFKMQGVCPDFSLNLAADSSDITFFSDPRLSQDRIHWQVGHVHASTRERILSVHCLADPHKPRCGGSHTEAHQERGCCELQERCQVCHDPHGFLLPAACAVGRGHKGCGFGSRSLPQGH